MRITFLAGIATGLCIALLAYFCFESVKNQLAPSEPDESSPRFEQDPTYTGGLSMPEGTVAIAEKPDTVETFISGIAPIIRDPQPGQTIGPRIRQFIRERPEESRQLIYGELSTDESEEMASAIRFLVALEWVKTNPEKTSEIADILRPVIDSGGLAQIVTTGAEQLAIKRPADAVHALDKLEGAERMRAYGDVIESLIKSNDLIQAESITQDMPPGRIKFSMIGYLARAKFKTDANATIKWAESLDLNEERSAAFNKIAEAAEALSLADTRNLLANVVDTDFRTRMLHSLVWNSQNASESLQWAKEALPKDEALSYSKNILRHWAVRDLTEAASGVLEISDDELRQAGVSAVAGSYGGVNPKAGTQWLDSLPSEERPAAATSLLRRWLGEDPISASTWAGSLETGATRDAAAYVVADYLIGKGESEDAASWIEFINNKEMKAGLGERLKPD